MTSLALHRPTLSELAIRQQWLRDLQMMAFNAGWHLRHAGYDDATGCIDWPEAEWEAFIADYSEPARAGYFYLRDVGAGEFVGHTHYHLNNHGDAESGTNVVPARSGAGRRRCR